MFKIIEWANAFFNLFRENKFFSSKLVNGLLIVMALLYVTFITKAVIENNFGVTPVLPPITIETVKLLDNNISIDQAIFVIFSGKVNIRHSDTYILGSIINATTNVSLFDKVTAIEGSVLDDAIENRTPLKLNVGHLLPGKYILRAEIHNICGAKSSIILAPLVSFEVSR